MQYVDRAIARGAINTWMRRRLAVWVTRPCTIGKIRRRSKNKILRLMLIKKDFQNNCHYESIADLFIIINTTSRN